MDALETEYISLPSYQGNGDDTPLEDGRPIRYQYAPERSNARWNHIVDLDSFFTKVYEYHQRHGFACMFVQEFFGLAQFVFVVLFATFILQCVDYPILFRDKALPNNTKVSFADAVIPISQCASSLPTYLVICLFIAVVVLICRIIKIVYNLFQFLEIKEFYSTALKIKECELDNMTWHEVQRRLQEVQREQQMCIHKQELTELDIYHRILRYKNYMVAMVNKDILPIKFNVPLLGEQIILSHGLKSNFEYLIMKGYNAPFSQWSLREEYKSAENRTMLSKSLSKRSRVIGGIFLLLSPGIFIWQVLYSFFSYGELVKREPGFFGVRRWSLYGRLYLRHFNELDHELNARLTRGYRPAAKYMSIFTSHMLAVIAKNVVFFSGSIVGVLLLLTIYDEDVLQVEHALTALTLFSAVIAAGQVFIPDENLIWCPEKFMYNILAHVHYRPHHWRGNSHTMKVRNEFGQLFQYKASYLLTELFSPFITPFIMILVVPKRCEKIVDFLRNFTVSVVGVGDVCSFAQMDLRKHGSPDWLSKGQTENVGLRSRNGKIELSLMHFRKTNPEWKPPTESVAYLEQIRDFAQRDANQIDILRAENPLYCSLYSMSSLGDAYSGLVTDVVQNLTQSMSGSLTNEGLNVKPPTMRTLRGGLSHLDGPSYCSHTGILTSLHSANSGGGVGGVIPQGYEGRHFYDDIVTDLNAADMSFSALYLHELHHLQISQHRGESSGRPSWQDTPRSGQGEMANIIEIPHEEENAESMPLLDFRNVCST